MIKKKTPMNSTTYSVTDLPLIIHYTPHATAVVSGKELAGLDICHACQRHLRDLTTENTREILWNVALLSVLFVFSKVLKLNGGHYEGKIFKVLP